MTSRSSIEREVSNVVVDALSHVPIAEFNAISILSSDLMQRIQRSWVIDSAIVHLIHSIVRYPSKHTKYTWRNNQLCKKYRLMVGSDSQLCNDLLPVFHSSSTGGILVWWLQ